ncbi:hypothetical protein [Micromonospora radicis]|uniref:hypothetical protein n=1 Tax=Micromonospora radicis TaxID=1894971 RepID=UPI0013145E95|nr:hypothetical protein [Micromonospora radicis]
MDHLAVSPGGSAEPVPRREGDGVAAQLLDAAGRLLAPTMLVRDTHRALVDGA